MTKEALEGSPHARFYGFVRSCLAGVAFAACASSRADALPVRPALLEPDWILTSADTHLRLDAWNYDSFTTDGEGHVTAWADLSGNGHNATAYKIGDDQVYGTVGVTNGVPAYLMGDIGSRIDLQFERSVAIRTVFWVMDIVGQHGYNANNIAFFLGDSYAYGYDFHGGYSGQIASADASPAFREGLFRIDGDDSYSGHLTTSYAPAGMHLYTAVPTNSLRAGHVSRDRTTSTTRVGGRALSELIILMRPLETNEIETVETYLNAKWFHAVETVLTAVDAAKPLVYPSLTLSSGAAFRIEPAAYQTAPGQPVIGVFGRLSNATGGRIRIESAGGMPPFKTLLLACGEAEGIASLDDFELVGFPDSAVFAWDGTRLTMSCDATRTFVPAVFRNTTGRQAELWLDAADAASFTTNAAGGVTAWADRSGSGYDALAYQLGAEQKYGVRGYTNGVPAYLMGPCASDVDLRFSTASLSVRTVYWVMDIVRETPYTSSMGGGSGTGWPTAFFLGSAGSGGTYDFHRGQESPYNSTIAHPTYAPILSASDFRIDGVQVNPAATKPAPGTHLYSAFLPDVCRATCLSNDRNSLKRNGGRALSELVLFDFELTDSEKAQVANYLGAKWFGETAALAAETNAVPAPVSFPNLVLNEGARFKVGGPALRTGAAGVSVFGSLQKGTAEKVCIDYVGAPVGRDVLTVFECEGLAGYTKADFVVTGFPANATPYWEGNALKVRFAAEEVVPSALAESGDEAPWVWFDAAAAATFTTDGDGHVTAWADRGARGNDAVAYQIGETQVYGTTGTTNGVPAYFMGGIGSGIDLRFPCTSAARTFFWVMDIVPKCPDGNHLAFFIGCGDGITKVYADSYPFHRGYSGQILSSDASAHVMNGRFAVDGDFGTYTGNLLSLYPPEGTHLYSAIATGDCWVNQISRDRTHATRHGGRALSELIVFNRELSDPEYAAVENYLNAKWFGKKTTLATATNAATAVSFPYLTLDDGAAFTISRNAFSKTGSAVTVFGALEKGTADKIGVAYAGDGSFPTGRRRILACVGSGGISLSDFTFTGFPAGVVFKWDGRELVSEYLPGTVLIFR